MIRKTTTTARPAIENLEGRTLMSASYTVVDLGVVNAPINNVITGITDSGIAYNANGYWTPGKRGRYNYTPFAPGGGTNPKISEINEAAQFAGHMNFTNGGNQPGLFRLKKGGAFTAQKLGDLYGEGSHAIGLNNLGQVTGYAMISNGKVRATFSYVGKDGLPKTLDLDKVKPATAAIEIRHAQDVTDNGILLVNGDVAGKSTTTRAGLMTLGKRGPTFVELPPLIATERSISAAAINENAWVVGSSTTPGFNDFQAVVWRSGKKGAMYVTPLPTLGGDISKGNSVNETGQIVGFSNEKYGDENAVLWTATKKGFALTDLNAYAPNGQDIRTARGINNHGWIVAESVDGNYNSHALLLIPKTGKTAAPAVAKPMIATAPAPTAATVFSTKPIEETAVWL